MKIDKKAFAKALVLVSMSWFALIPLYFMLRKQNISPVVAQEEKEEQQDSEEND